MVSSEFQKAYQHGWPLIPQPARCHAPTQGEATHSVAAGHRALGLRVSCQCCRRVVQNILAVLPEHLSKVRQRDLDSLVEFESSNPSEEAFSNASPLQELAQVFTDSLSMLVTFVNRVVIGRFLTVKNTGNYASDGAFAFIKAALDCVILSHEGDEREVDFVINLKLRSSEGMFLHHKGESLGCFLEKVVGELLVHITSINLWHAAFIFASSLKNLEVVLVTLRFHALHVVERTIGMDSHLHTFSTPSEIGTDVNDLVTS